MTMLKGLPASVIDLLQSSWMAQFAKLMGIHPDNRRIAPGN
jgi:hypothetical protein